MKRLLLLLGFLVCAAPLALHAHAQSPEEAAAAVKDETAIREAMTAQVAAWNRGDINAFMQGYEDSSETTFVGKSVKKGYRPILERYKKSYATRAQMGALTFSDLDVRLLPSTCGTIELALVTGRFHLDRAEHGSAKKDKGIFSLVCRKGPHGWKIILDHTS
jgi:uncharacterized protein (TIGR02246 family)